MWTSVETDETRMVDDDDVAIVQYAQQSQRWYMFGLFDEESNE